MREGEQTAVVVAPRQSTRQKLCTDLQDVLNTRRLQPAHAGKLRGQSGWLASNSFGRVGRLGQAVLKRIQYDKQHRFNEHDTRALAFHMHVIMHVPPRSVPLKSAPIRPLVMYTDAEFTEGQLPKIGIVLFRDPPLKRFGFASEVPGSLVATWTDRRQQISGRDRRRAFCFVLAAARDFPT